MGPSGASCCPHGPGERRGGPSGRPRGKKASRRQPLRIPLGSPPLVLMVRGRAIIGDLTKTLRAIFRDLAAEQAVHVCPRQAAVVRVRAHLCCVFFDLSDPADVSLPEPLCDIWDGGWSRSAAMQRWMCLRGRCVYIGKAITLRNFVRTPRSVRHGRRPSRGLRRNGSMIP